MSIEVTRNFHALPETPLVPVRLNSDDVVIWCKLDLLNLSGSSKDRIASFIVAKAFRQGHLRAGDCVIEASSGSMSIEGQSPLATENGDS